MYADYKLIVEAFCKWLIFRMNGLRNVMTLPEE